MNANRITAALVRFPIRNLIPTPHACVFARHASTKSTNDEHTLAKSADTLTALMGSTFGLGAKSTTVSTSTSTSSSSYLPTVKQASDTPANGTTADMFIPPAHDPLLGYITAVIQQHGLRARAARIVSRMLLHIHTFTRAPPTPIVREAIMTAAPAVRVVSFKYGTKVMMTPQPLTEKQRVRAGLKAIIAASESRAGQRLEVRLAREMIAVVQGESRSLGEKERLHRLAMVNRGNLRR